MNPEKINIYGFSSFSDGMVSLKFWSKTLNPFFHFDFDGFLHIYLDLIKNKSNIHLNKK